MFYVGRRLTNEERLTAIEKCCKPLPTYQFPSSEEYGKQRAFKKSWFDDYSWLAYSTFEDGAYCKVCALFCDSSKADRLVRCPLRFWRTATQKFKKHEKSEVHKNAYLQADCFIKVMKSKQKPVNEQLSSALALQVEKNRKKLRPMPAGIKTPLFRSKHQKLTNFPIL